MTTKARRIFCILISILAFGGLAAIFPGLPAEIPLHWDLNGEVTLEAKGQLWVFAGMLVFFNGMFEVLPHVDPRKDNYLRFQREYNAFCVVFNLFFLAFLGAVCVQALAPGAFDMVSFLWLVLGILLTFVGNLMPKFKSNFFSGVKTPWALSDDENWRKTQRLGGKLIFVSGLIWIACALFGLPSKAVLFLGLGSVFTAALVPYGMSYYWWRKKEEGR